MTDEDLALLSNLIQTRSENPPGGEQAVAEALAAWLAARGVQVEVQPLGAGRANLVARVRGQGRRPALAFCGHLDTVQAGGAAWRHAPFSAEIVDGELYGRGASDMKSGVAAAAAALARLQARAGELAGDVLLLATAGEEVDSCGASTLVERGAFREAGAVVIGEPTGMSIGVAHKGALWLRAIFPGRAAHGSMPHLGANAIQHAMQFLRLLEQQPLAAPAHPWLGQATISANVIRAGAASNVVPDRCELTLDVRTIPGLAHPDVLDHLRRLIALSLPPGLADRGALEVILDRAPVDTDPGAPVVQAAARAARAVLGTEPVLQGMTYFTDGSVIGPATGLPILILGPGEPGQAHQTDEHVAVERVLACVDVYERLAVEYAGRA